MTSIATQLGDAGQTSLVGGQRVSKGALRVESYGTVDELNAALGFARSICSDEGIATATLAIQRELFQVAAALATPTEARKGAPPVTQAMVDELTGQVHALEAVSGLLSDWSVPGGDPAGAFYDLARTVCRRAERCVVRLGEEEELAPHVLAYLNRLSDLLWLFGRKLEVDAQAQAALRELNDKPGPRWSRAW
ncbi:MAG: cob(I)yrinic acid a,c-diamide adenosyltransferase [Acidobacteria bacterium]|nr:cob(I)yrinic acid a,c-diamide adenosyltransferase [Acidobacteriota bacterium]